MLRPRCVSKRTTALGAYIKSFTYEINQHMHANAHTQVHARMLTHACTHEHVVRNLYYGKYVRGTRVEG